MLCRAPSVVLVWRTGGGGGGGGEPTENQRTKGNRKQNVKKPTVMLYTSDNVKQND